MGAVCCIPLSAVGCADRISGAPSADSVAPMSTTYVIDSVAATLGSLGNCTTGQVGLVTSTSDGGVADSLYYCTAKGAWTAIACNAAASGSVAYVPGASGSLFVCSQLSWIPVPIPPGAQGDAGPQGPQGQAGAAGATGGVGATGPTGATGAQGPVGSNGLNGLNGFNGLNGTNGSSGPQGATGPQGPQGSAGLAGTSGATGAQGPPGVAGATGATGPQGVPGEEGSPGAPGSQIEVTPEPPGANCATGGERIDVGEVVDGGFEIQQSTYVCNGNGTAPDASPSCGTTQSLCLGTCVYTAVDWANCGVCGHQCSTGQTCQEGLCGTCQLTDCNNRCVNVLTDSNDCGACGNICPTGDTCVDGVCM
jgi:hypothetical protein